MSLSRRDVLDWIKSRSTDELRAFSEALEAETGIDLGLGAPEPWTTMGVPLDVMGEVGVVEFDAWLDGCGEGSRIAIIKVVRRSTGLGLKESKALVESAPVRVVEAIERERAEEIVALLRDAGAEASVR